MELTALLRLFARRWWLIAVPAVLSAIFTFPSLIGGDSASAGGYSSQIRYSAAQELNLPQRDGDYQDVWLASELTVNAFTDWARSSSFRQEIMNVLDDETVGFADLGIAADNARSIGVIYLSHGDSEALHAIARAAIVVLSSRSQTYFPQLGGEAAQVTILEQPQILSAPAPLTNRAAPLFRLAAGLFIGFVLAILADYFDARVHHSDDLRRLGLPVLGVIPKRRF